MIEGKARGYTLTEEAKRYYFQLVILKVHGIAGIVLTPPEFKNNQKMTATMTAAEILGNILHNMGVTES